MARFFSVACFTDDAYEITDKLASRYGWTPSVIEALDVVTLYKMLKKALEGERRREAREQWVAMLPLMVTKQAKFIEFEEYYEQTTGKNIDMRTDEEILAEVAEVRAQLNT